MKNLEAMAIKKGTLTAKQLRKLYALELTEKHTGKMSGMISLSTDVRDNKYCQARRKNGNLVCAQCYADSMLNGRMKNSVKFRRNAQVLQSGVIPFEWLPVINASVFRFEAFGDLGNVYQAINYLNIAKKNPQTRFGWWTKNPFLIAQALKAGYEKPDNVVIIYSVPNIDGGFFKIDCLKKIYPFIDKFFFVWSSNEKAAAAGKTINCGKRHCLSCQKCYHKDNGIEEIHEQLK